MLKRLTYVELTKESLPSPEYGKENSQTRQ